MREKADDLISVLDTAVVHLLKESVIVKINGLVQGKPGIMRKLFSIHWPHFVYGRYALGNSTLDAENLSSFFVFIYRYYLCLWLFMFLQWPLNRFVFL